METTEKTKFCKHCGAKIPEDAVLCTACGRQVEKLEGVNTPNIVINNSNSSQNVNSVFAGKLRNKWVAIVLCLFGGTLGLHKFYEGKIGMGILYLCTLGLFYVGVIIDFIALLAKPNPYMP